jgi:hypothetical protein
MARTNSDVVKSFLEHKPLKGPLTTDGYCVWSYGVVIAKWVSETRIVMPGFNVFYSKTTSRHRALVSRAIRASGIEVKRLIAH